MKSVRSQKPRMAAIGTFDGVHVGHKSLISDLVETCDLEGYEPMAVTFDRHPFEVIAPDKAPRLLMGVSDRCDVLRSLLSCVAVLDFDEEIRRMTARDFMAMLRDRYGVGAIFMGFNHHFGSDGLRSAGDYRAVASTLGMRIFEGREAEAGGLKVSSSIIRDLLSQGDVCMAGKCLGRPYRLSGKVGSGMRIGRRLGFPTANMTPLEPRQMVPACGVYACLATLDTSRRCKSMVNIGNRPTVDSSGKTTIEAHLLDFEGDLYGKPLALDFICRLRDERPFGSMELLAEQLRADAAMTSRILSEWSSDR